MKKIYLALDDIELISKVKKIYNLSDPTLSFESVKVSAELLKTIPDDSLLIVDKIYDEIGEISETENKFSVITLNDSIDDFSGSPFNFYIPKQKMITGLVLALEEVKNSKLEAIVSEYMAIEMTQIKPKGELPCDIFLKLSKSKYIKIVNRGEILTVETLVKYKEKDVKYFYLMKNDFYKHGQDLYLNKLVNEKFDNFEANYIHQYMDTLHDMAATIGIPEKIINSVGNTYKNIAEKSSDKMVKSLMLQFKQQEGTFLFNHSYMTGLIGTAIGASFDWMSFENKEKMFLASVLHDLGFKNSKLALYESAGKSEIKKLDSPDKDEVLGHVDAIVETLRSNSNIPADVISMVYYHHGAKGEESYPKVSHATEINHITAHFILSHELTLKLFKIAFNPLKFESILKEIEEEFNKGNIRSIMPTFIAGARTLLIPAE